MGTWGVGSFENDDAMDWSYELHNGNDLSPILTVFSNISEGAYLEAPDCSNALAAAEVVAALKGKPSKNLPDEIATWISFNKPSVNNEIITNAKKIVTQIKQSSELKELWEESEDLAKWENTVNDLILRLESNDSDEPLLTFADWQREKWYIFVILAGVCSALAQLFISRFSVMIGMVAAYAISYVIYSANYSE